MDDVIRLFCAVSKTMVKHFDLSTERMDELLQKAKNGA